MAQNDDNQHLMFHPNFDEATPCNANNFFGLEMQYPWSRYLLEGRKTIEVRTYELPLQLTGRKIYIMESQQGEDGISTLVDRIEFLDSSLLEKHDGNDTTAGPKCHTQGWCIFDSVKEYKSQAQFCADETRHLVSRDSGYAWKEGKTKILYGWVVKERSQGNELAEQEDMQGFLVAVRRKRSIFQLYKNLSDAK